MPDSNKLHNLSVHQDIGDDAQLWAAYLGAYKKTICEFIHAFEMEMAPESVLLRPQGSRVRNHLYLALDQLLRTAPEADTARLQNTSFKPTSWDRKAAQAAAVTALSLIKTMTNTVKSSGEASVPSAASQNAFAAITSLFSNITDNEHGNRAQAGSGNINVFTAKI